MLIHESAKQTPRYKEMKVKLPVGLYIRLHSMKVLTGKPLSEALTEALEAYFDEAGAPWGGSPAETSGAA